MFLRERLTGYLKDELVVGGVRAMRVLVRHVAGDDPVAQGTRRRRPPASRSDVSLTMILPVTA
jgi:hypothetical protein